MKPSYFEEVLEKIIDDSKYDDENIDFFSDIEIAKLIQLNSSFVDKIYLFGSKKKYSFDLSKMLVLFEDRNAFWYDFQKNKGNINKFVLYASLLAYDKSTSIFEQYQEENINFVDKKYLSLAEEITSFCSFNLPNGFLVTLLTQALVSASYLLKCENMVFDFSKVKLLFGAEALLPVTLPLGFLTLSNFRKNICREQNILKQYFSKFEQANFKFKKSLCILFYTMGLSNLIFSSIDNSDRLLNIINHIENKIDNPFSDLDVSNLDDDWSYNQLEEAILKNDGLSDADKEMYLKNLEVVFDDYDYDLEHLYYVFSTVRTRDVSCCVEADGGDSIILACYTSSDNTIYDFVNSYNHDDVEMINLVRSHEIGHSFGTNGKYSWLNEGMNTLIQNEYFGYDTYAYDKYVVIVKYFCELLGTDVVLDAYFGTDEDAISGALSEFVPLHSPSAFLSQLDDFNGGYPGLLDVMEYCAECAYNLDDGNSHKLTDGSMMQIMSYLRYLDGTTDSYTNRGYVSTEYKEKMDKNPVLIKRR